MIYDLMIYDFQTYSGFGGFVNSGKNCSEFAGFCLQLADSPSGKQGTFLHKFQPEERLVGFLQDPADLVDPVSVASRAAGGAITRSDCGCRAHYLVSNDFAFGRPWQSVGHSHNAQCELFCSGLKLFSIHPGNLRASVFAWKHK
jgi:hypothetical protein